LDFFVSEQQDRQGTGYLERVNADLSTSLRRCHRLVEDARFLLASNSNDRAAANDGEGEDDRNEA
jgi:hypothetical protein